MLLSCSYNVVTRGKKSYQNKDMKKQPENAPETESLTRLAAQLLPSFLYAALSAAFGSAVPSKGYQTIGRWSEAWVESHVSDV